MKNVTALWVSSTDEIIDSLNTLMQGVIGVTPNLIEMERTLIVPEFQSEADEVIRKLSHEIALRGDFITVEGVRCLNMSNQAIIDILKELTDAE